MENETILVTGAGGQIGTELVLALRKKYKNVIASDLKDGSDELKQGGEFIRLDVLYKNGLADCVKRFNVTQVYHLAAILSATGEKNPEMAWRINMKGLRNVLDVCLECGVKKMFFPSTIAVFGPTTPKVNTPQFTVMEPNTIYGISKQAGERWCDWYFQKHGLDVRSMRYPGLISYKTKAGGGTTDYAVEIFFEAVANKKYECFLKEDTALPMMYMPDAIRGTIDLMEAPVEKISTRSGYNFSGFSIAPKDVVAEIRKHIPEFEVTYKPDFRQHIAESWPQSIDDSVAQKDWGWKPEYDLAKMAQDMIVNIRAMQPVL
ncbi:MAG TPA: NAD-dependent epimerase/dehydratase family protein [Chitinophagales bacterium]|nr:NAD-dependent epimerase/dehydratase family protein [Chitinophagales bacterium]